jgi:hypothetical protein
VFADDCALYRDNTLNSTKNQIEMNKFDKISRYKISIQKLAEQLYANSELSEKKSRNSPMYKRYQKKQEIL